MSLATEILFWAVATLVYGTLLHASIAPKSFGAWIGTIAAAAKKRMDLELRE